MLQQLTQPIFMWVKKLQQEATKIHHPINLYHIKRSVAYVLEFSYSYKNVYIKDGPLYLQPSYFSRMKAQPPTQNFSKL